MYTNKEQAWNGNTIDLLTDHRSLHQWLLWLAIASSASAVASGVVDLLVDCRLTPDVHSACVQPLM